MRTRPLVIWEEKEKKEKKNIFSVLLACHLPCIIELSLLLASSDKVDLKYIKKTKYLT